MAGTEGDYENDVEVCPNSKRNRRACMVCSLIKTYEQFLAAGCENCEANIKLSNDDDAVERWTSENFQGVIALLIPNKSWVARWQTIVNFVPGCYAISVSGRLSGEEEDVILRTGINYISRDTSTTK